LSSARAVEQKKQTPWEQKRVDFMTDTSQKQMRIRCG
jgi:hypothetical protein